MASLRDKWITLSSAIGMRRFVIGSIIILAVAILNFILNLLREGGVIASVPTWAVVIMVPLVAIIWWLLDYATTLRLAAEPVLRIDYEERFPFMITEPPDTDGLARRTVRVRITNTGQEDLSSCLVKLEEFTSNGKAVTTVTPIGLMTQHQAGEERAGGNFALRAGEPKLVNVVKFDETAAKSKFEIQYESDKYAKDVPRGNYILNISAYGGASPANKIFRMFLNEKGRLRFLEETNETQNG